MTIRVLISSCVIQQSAINTLWRLILVYLVYLRFNGLEWQVEFKFVFTFGYRVRVYIQGDLYSLVEGWILYYLDLGVCILR